jgi:Uma2 family endonuclease
MTGGFNDADTIGLNLTTALRTRLRGNACRPSGPNAGVETINKSKKKALRYPDALVSCSKRDGKGQSVPGAVVIFEVVGNTPDAIQRDHFEKVDEYATVPSILRYVIVESAIVGLTIRERSTPDEPWRVSFLKTTDEVLFLPEIGIDIPVAELYEDVSFSNQGDTSA